MREGRVVTAMRREGFFLTVVIANRIYTIGCHRDINIDAKFMVAIYMNYLQSLFSSIIEENVIRFPPLLLPLHHDNKLN